jgi:hypothetical protein
MSNTKDGGEKEKKNWMTARPPTDTYRGKVDAKGVKLHPNASEAVLRRAKMRKCTDTVPLAHPPSRTYPITVHSSRLEEGRSHKLNPTRNAVRQSKPRVEQPGNRLRLSHILTTHVKVQRLRAQLQNQSRPRQRITQKQAHRQSTDTGQNHKEREGERGARRRRDEEKRGARKSLTRCISAKVQTRAHNFQPEKIQSSACLRMPDSCQRIGR